MKRPKISKQCENHLFPEEREHIKAQDKYIDYLLDGIQKALAKLIRANF